MIDVFEGLLAARLAGEGGTAMADVFDGLLAARLFGDSGGTVVWGEYDGTLPAAYTADGSYLADYRVYGASGGVGDETESGEPAGYKVPISVSDGTTSATTPIYIGGTALGEDEYIDYGAGKIYRTTKNIMPSAAAGSATDHGVTVTCDGNSTYQISGRANGNAVIRFDLREFTIPAALDNGGNGVIALSYPRDPDVTIYLLDGNNAVYTINPYYGNVYTDYGVGLSIDGIAFAIADGQYADEFPFIIMITNDGTVPSVIDDYVPHLTPTDPPVPLPQLPTCEGVTTTDYAGKATAETETNNIIPSAVAETKTVGNTTVTCDGHGRYHITKSGSGDNYVSFNVPEFTIPISVAGGGNGTVSFFNTMSDKAAVAFYYGSSKIDSWNMNSANRQTNSYGTMAGKVCDKIEINAWGSSTWTGDICIMFTNDGVLPTAFIPHIVETAKPRPGRFYAKYRGV